MSVSFCVVRDVDGGRTYIYIYDPWSNICDRVCTEGFFFRKKFSWEGRCLVLDSLEMRLLSLLVLVMIAE